MIFLLVFAFLGGIATILSPCILPILPIILSSSVDSSGKGRPLGIVTGFVSSFTFFTLFLSIIVNATGVSADNLRVFSVAILIFFGLSLFVTPMQIFVEKMFTKLSSFAPKTETRKGFLGGLLVGFSLGLLWTPCVGPILASVISIAISGKVTVAIFLVTLAYSLGTALPMLLIMNFGNTLFQRIPFLKQNTVQIQKAFGFVMVMVAVGIYFNVDRNFQAYILRTFPQYGVEVTKVEDNDLVKKNLKSLE